MIDTHCHLTHQKFTEDLPAVVQQAKNAGLQACITIGTGTDDGAAALELSKAYSNFIFCGAGIDPFSAHKLGDAFDSELSKLNELLSLGNFVALGEVGLDYHYDLSPRALQRQQLEKQLELASQLNLPVVIHVREAHADMTSILANFQRMRGVIHSFTGGPDEAEAYLDFGWHLSFNGIMTFPSAKAIRAAAAIVPQDKLLVETDSPYLAPVPHRGRRCVPADVVKTIECLADVRGVTPQQISHATCTNARRLFNLS